MLHQTNEFILMTLIKRVRNTRIINHSWEPLFSTFGSIIDDD